MLQSLRARLAFLFAGTLVLATVTAAVVVVSLYQSYNRDQTEAEQYGFPRRHVMLLPRAG